MSLHYRGQTGGTSFATQGVGAYFAAVAVPDGVAVGDLLVAVVSFTTYYDTVNGMWTNLGQIFEGAGWTQLEYEQALDDASSNTGVRAMLAYKVVQPGDPDIHLFKLLGTNNFYSWSCVAYGGQDLSSPIDARSANPEATPTTTPTATGITTSVDNTALVHFVVHPQSTLTAYPSGFTGVTPALYDVIQASISTKSSAGATGDKAATIDPADPAVSFLVAVAPDTTPISVTGSDAAATTRFGIPEFYTRATSTEFDELVASEGSGDLRFLVQLEPYSPSAGAVVTSRFADKGMVTLPSETPANTPWLERARRAINASRSLFDGKRIGGSPSVSAGSIELINKDGSLDFMKDLNWDRRRVVIRLGGRIRRTGQRLPLSSYQTILVAEAVQTPEVNRSGVVIALRDRSSVLDQDFQTNVYAGTGGAEGGPDLAGKRKPVCIGYCPAAPGVQVSEVDNQWQVSDPARGSVSIALMRDGGGEVDSSRYTFDPVTNIVTVLFNLFGTPTFDVVGIGDTTRAGDLIVKATEPVLSYPNDFDQNSYLAYLDEYPGVAGTYVGLDEKVSYKEVVRRLVSPGGMAYFLRSGKIWMGLFKEAIGEPGLVLGNDDVKRFQRVATADPWWRISLGHTRCWTRLEGNSLIGNVRKTEVETFFAQDYRTSYRDDASILTAHPGSEQSPLLESALCDLDAAEEEAQRLFEIYSKDWEVVWVDTHAVGYKTDLGGLVRLTWSREGVSSQTYRVVGVEEVGPTVRLQLWRTTPPKVLAIEGDLAPLVTEDGSFTILI